MSMEIKNKQNPEKGNSGIENNSWENRPNKTGLEQRRQAFDELVQASEARFQQQKQDILKFVNGTPYQEFFAGKQFAEPTKSVDAATAAMQADGDQWAMEMNQTIGWYMRNALDQIGKETIAGTDEYTSVQRAILQQKPITDD